MLLYHLQDIMKFMVLFWLVIGVFMVSLQDVFWYYSQRSNIEIAYEGRQHVEGVKAEDAFEGFVSCFLGFGIHTYRIECLIYMRFPFLYLHLFSATEHVSHGKAL